MQLIFGLGNPDKKYKNTRHNLGAMLIEHLRDTLPSLSTGIYPLYQWSTHRLKGQLFNLITPNTPMNHSGYAVKAAIQQFDSSPSQCIICFDDIYLPYGSLRLRLKGGHGNQNGFTHIISVCQTQQIPRLRLGIDSNFEYGQMSTYVLSPFTKEELSTLNFFLEHAGLVIITCLTCNNKKAMEIANQKKTFLSSKL